MSAGSYLAGALFALGVYGSAFVAVELAVRTRLPQLRGAPRAVAWGILATAALLLVHLVPAALGVLSRETALLAALALLGAAFLTARSAGPRPAETAGADDDAPRPPLEWGLATVGLLGAAIWLAVALLEHADLAPTGFDAASAYFPTAARWMQEGSIWEIADWVPSAFYGSGPGNGSIVVLSAMLPWSDDFLAHLAIYPYVVLTAVALYALAREGGSPRPAAILLALMVTASPVVVIPGLADGLLDPVMYASLAAGVLFLIRHNRTAARADLLLAAVALGICFGTKFYGYTTVATVLVVWAGARLACRAAPRLVIRDLLLAGAVVLAAGGIWMLRNWVETGNPLMPVKIAIGGLTIFDAPPDPQRPVIGASLASYLDQPAVWIDTLAHQFRIAVGIGLLIVAGACVAAAALLFRARRSAWEVPERVAATALVAAAAAAVVYLVTPYSAPGFGTPDAAAINVRYGIPALILAVPALGWLAARLAGAWSAVLCVLLLLGTIDALRVGTVTTSRSVYVCFALALALTAVGLVVRRRGGELPAIRVGPRLAASIVALAALVALGYFLQRDYAGDRYAGEDPAIEYVTGLDAARVGLAGSWSTAGVSPTYPSFGGQLDNDVSYLGTVEDALLEAPGSQAEFDAALVRADPDVVLIGRERVSSVPGVADPIAPGILAAWARAQGFESTLRTPRFLVMSR